MPNEISAAARRRMDHQYGPPDNQRAAHTGREAGEADPVHTLARLRAENKIMEQQLAAITGRQVRRDLVDLADSYIANLPNYSNGMYVGGAEGAKQVSKWLGVPLKKLDAYAKVKGFFSNGTFLLEDGQIVGRDELDEAVGLTHQRGRGAL